MSSIVKKIDFDVAYAIIINMKKNRLGFTLIEVSLFLAITAFLFVGISAGVQNSIYQQRYNDSVQNYVEFLRSVYSEVLNVQGQYGGAATRGQSLTTAIYGRLVVFDVDDKDNKNDIKVYMVVGDADTSKVSSASTVQEKFVKLNLSTLAVEVSKKDNGEMENFKFVFPSTVEEYTPRWSTKIVDCYKSSELFKGALLIVRHPDSGVVYTMFDEAIDGGTVWDIIEDKNGTVENNISNYESIVKEASPLISGDGSTTTPYTLAGFKPDGVEMCVNPSGDTGGLMTPVVIEENARNSTGIVIEDAKRP